MKALYIQCLLLFLLIIELSFQADKSNTMMNDLKALTSTIGETVLDFSKDNELSIESDAKEVLSAFRTDS